MEPAEPKKRKMRRRVPKQGELIVYWGQVERGDTPSLVYNGGGGPGASTLDAMALWELFEGVTLANGLTFKQDLERRGFDLSTLRFSVRQKGYEHEQCPEDLRDAA